ncbi:MAG: hypothetical protein DSY91_02205, partial [Deltaproteobacteria bacterium]
MDEALKLLKELRGHEGKGRDVDVKIGLIYFEQKKYDEAIKAFKRAQKRYPHSQRIQYYLGTVYGEKGELEKAIGYLTQ